MIGRQREAPLIVFRPGTSLYVGVERRTLVLQNSEGHSEAICRDLAERMTAGTGKWHSEWNDRAGTNEPVVLVQIWIVPNHVDATAGYEQVNLSQSDLDG
jgi:redox-sensitive bicupin YhaK (pirin superfamily)